MQRVKKVGRHVMNGKNKLFITGAYLLVAASLLLLLSYGRYRTKIEGSAIMPEAALLEVSLDLDKNLSETTDFSEYLTDLQPGDSAKDYAAAYKASATNTAVTNHKIQVIIRNSDTKDGVTTATDLGFDYTLRITSSGKLPLEFIMINGEKTYISKRESSGKEYRFYQLTIVEGLEVASDTEAKFTMEATKGSSDTYQIFAGWDNLKTMAATLTDMKYRKEVELLELKADVTGKTTQYGVISKEELKNRIPTATDTGIE